MLCAVAHGKRTWHSLMEQCPVPVLLSHTRVGQPLHVLTLRILQQLKGSLKKKLPSSHKPMEHSACSRLRGFAELLPLRGCLMLLVCVSPGVAFPCQSTLGLFVGHGQNGSKRISNFKTRLEGKD